MEVYRGDIFYVYNAGYNTGAEMQSGRPAIIVSNDIGNEHAPVVSVVYLTTQEKKPLPTHVKVVCKQESTAICEQIYTVAKERLGDYIRTLSDDEMKEVNVALACAIGLTIAPVDGEELAETQARLDRLNYEFKKKTYELDHLSESNSNPDVIKVSVERDLYKNLYEQLLNKFTA